MRTLIPMHHRVASFLLALVFACGAVLSAGAVAQQTEEKVCEFNRYQGYSSPQYDAWIRESFFIPAAVVPVHPASVAAPSSAKAAIEVHFMIDPPAARRADRGASSMKGRGLTR